MKDKIKTICDKRVEELHIRKKELQDNTEMQELEKRFMVKQLTIRIEETQIIKNLILREL